MFGLSDPGDGDTIKKESLMNTITNVTINPVNFCGFFIAVAICKEVTPIIPSLSEILGRA